jgi:hypothetical protein
LQSVHDDEFDTHLIFFSEEAWFHLQGHVLLLLELLGNRLIEPVFFNSLQRPGLFISFWEDLYFVFPLVGI